MSIVDKNREAMRKGITKKKYNKKLEGGKKKKKTNKRAQMRIRLKRKPSPCGVEQFITLLLIKIQLSDKFTASGQLFLRFI